MKSFGRCCGLPTGVRITCGACSGEQPPNEAGIVVTQLSRLEMLREHSTGKAAHFVTRIFEVLPRFGVLRWCRVFEHETTNHSAGEWLPDGTRLFKRSSCAYELLLGVVACPYARCIVRASICLAKQARTLVETHRLGFIRRVLFQRISDTKTRLRAANPTFRTAQPVV